MNANNTAMPDKKSKFKEHLASLQKSCVANLLACIVYPDKSGLDLAELRQTITDERVLPEYFDDPDMREVFTTITTATTRDNEELFTNLTQGKEDRQIVSWMEDSCTSMVVAKSRIKRLAEMSRVVNCAKINADAFQRFQSGEINADQFGEIGRAAYQFLDHVYPEPEDDEYGPTLDELGPQIPEEENPNVLIRDDFLKIGGSMILVAAAGAGKSTMSTQMAYAWALGRDAFGLRPARPLRIGVFQTEDDEDALRLFRDGIKLGYKNHLGWTDEDLAKADSNLRFPKVKGLTGQEILAKIRRLQRGKKKFDLIILNPLQGFTVGIDISDNSSLSEFLRVDLEKIISDEKMKCGLFIVHHTTKPIKDKSKTYLDYLYSGSGGNELTNWVRSKLVLEKSGDKYKLKAVKHGEELPWKMENDVPTVTICRSPKFSKEKFWSMDPPNQFDINSTASAATSDPAQPEKDDTEIVAEALRENGEATLTKALRIAQKCTSQKRGDKAFKEIREDPAKYGLKITKTGQGSKQIVAPLVE